ncbi:hypothetical protein [Streptomyces sp. PT12]|uniref:hypothetical protein n=1 Tax=Streptomyces sp. PT12 TaxID=1510197 RepID=UPI0015EF98EC|nr:hypothetical protein [Streptomyces sp. PT12]
MTAELAETRRRLHHLDATAREPSAFAGGPFAEAPADAEAPAEWADGWPTAGPTEGAAEGAAASPDDLWNLLGTEDDGRAAFPGDRGWDPASLFAPEPRPDAPPDPFADAHARPAIGADPFGADSFGADSFSADPFGADLFDISPRDPSARGPVVDQGGASHVPHPARSP